RSEFGDRRVEVGGRRSEVGDRRSEVGGRRSEVGDRRAEVGGRRSEVGVPVATCTSAPKIGRMPASRQTCWNRTTPQTPLTSVSARRFIPVSQSRLRESS